MITIKLDIKTDKPERILEYQKQYSNLLHVYYNGYKEGLSQTECKHLQLNGVELLDSWFRQSCIFEAKSIHTKNKNNKVIFGGKKNFINRLKKLISKDEFNKNRLSPLYSIGEISNPGVKCNRKFLIQDLYTIIFKPSKKEKIELNINVNSKKYKHYLELLMLHQEKRDLSITYKLSSEYIWISFDETILKHELKSFNTIQNRIISVDLNPNYIGYSVLDWKDSENFNIIDKGVLSLKSLNDKDNSIKCPSTDKQKLYLTNKRNFEVLEVSKFLVEKMKHYKCSVFAIEDLKIKSKDNNKEKKFNKLCNNQWCRVKLVNNLQKWCNIYSVNLIKIAPEYSSFIGNIVNRELKLPDMILSSIEISRRAFEFNHQYILKDYPLKKNVVWIELTNYIKNKIIQSLEELNICCDWNNLFELYSYIKKSKCKYRFPLEIDGFESKSYRFQLIFN